MVEQDDDVLFELNQTLGALDHHFSNLHVALGGFIEGRADGFAAHGALHFGHFLGALVTSSTIRCTSGWLATKA